MKRTLAWFAGLVGVAALGRLLTRHRRSAAPVSSDVTPAGAGEADQATPATDPAEELRRRLAAQRRSEPGSEGDGEPEAPPAADETLDERRARVHAKAREAMDAMRDEGPAA